MAGFEVFFSNKAKKFIQKCEPKFRARLRELFLVLGESPVPASSFDLKKIEGREDWYRIRLSSYRVQYEVRHESKEIHVMKIERRDEHTYD